MIPYTPMEFLDLRLVRIPMHGLMAVIGVILGFVIILGLGRKQKIAAKIIFAEAFWGGIGAWLGSKLMYYLGPYNHTVSSALSIVNRGFVFYGGIIGGILAMLIYTRLKNYNFWKHIDFWAIGIPLGIFSGRIGCFLAECFVGKETLFRFALQLPDGSIRHPVALYLSFFNILLFSFLYARRDTRRFIGQIILEYLMIYAVGRFLIDFLRVYYFYYLGLSFSQWTSIAVFTVALPLYLVKSRRL